MFSKRVISFSHLLRLPEEWQEGPYCGFYAMSIAMLILKENGKIGWAVAPRARSALPEHSEGVASLAYVARKYNGYLGGGPIYMSIMPTVLGRVGCHARLYHFDKFDVFQHVLMTSVLHGVPVIVPYDMGVPPRTVGFYRGERSHYGVVVGHRKSLRTGRHLVEIADAHKKPAWVPISILFASNRQVPFLGPPGSASMVVVYGPSTPFLEVRRRSVVSSPGAAPK